MPNHWSSKEVGWKIGKLFSQCFNVIILENGSRSGKIIKLFVEVELKKSLIRGTTMKLDDELVWVEFKYEHLPTFCFYCGLICHLEKNCGRKMLDSKESWISEGQYSDWMRVQGRIVGKREESNCLFWMRLEREWKRQVTGREEY